MATQRIISLNGGNTYIEIEDALGVVTAVHYENNEATPYRLNITDGALVNFSLDLQTSTTGRRSRLGLSLGSLSDDKVIRLTRDRGQFG